MQYFSGEIIKILSWRYRSEVSSIADLRRSTNTPSVGGGGTVPPPGRIWDEGGTPELLNC